MRTSLSIRARLIILVLIVALPLLTLGLYSVLIDVDSEILLAQQSSLALAQATAAGITQFVEDARFHLSAYSDRPFSRSRAKVFAGPVWTEFVRMYRQYDDLFVVDSSGKTLWDVKGFLGDRMPAGSSKTFLHKSAASRSMTASSPFVDQSDGQWACVLAYPRLDENQESIGTVCLLVHLSRFQDLLNGVMMPAAAVTTILDSHGIVIARSNNHKGWRGTDLGGTAIGDSVLRAEEGYFESTDSDGLKTLSGFATVKSTAWRVYVTLPKSVALDSLNHRVMREMFFGFLVTLLVSGLAYFIIRAIRRPVGQLSRVADRIAAGDYAARAEEGGPVEIAAVSLTVNRMLDMRSAFIEQLRESEERFRTLVESMDDIVYTLDCEQRHTAVYGRWLKKYGYPAEHFLGKTARDLFGPKDAEVHERENKLALDGKPVVYEWSWQTPTGALSFHTSVSPLQDANGNIRGIVGVGRDITERKQAEERIRKSEHNLAEAERIGNTGSWDYDVASDTASWSANMFRIFDVDPAMPTELIFKHFVEHLVHPDDRAHILSIFRDALGGKRPYDLEYRIVKGDGSIRNVHALAETLHDDNGKATRMIGRVEDITERKRVAEERRRDEETIRSQLDEITFYYDNVPVGLAVLDTDLRFLRINSRLADINGVPADMHVGKTVEEIVPTLAAQARTRASEILRTGKPFTDVEFNGQTAAQPGVIRNWLENWHPLEGHDSKISGFVVTVQDITERKQAEEARREAELLLRAVLDNAPITIFATDSHCVFTLSEGKALERVGLKSGENVGVSALDLFGSYPFVEETGEVILGKDVIHRALGGESMGAVSTLRGVHFDNRIGPMRDAEGAIVGIVGIAIDITERQKAEDALKKERALLSTIIDTIPDEICLKDTDSRYILANRASVSVLGAKSLAEIIGRTDLDYVRTELALRHLAEEKAILESREPVINRERVRLDPKTGEMIKCDLSTKFPIMDQDGNAIGLLVINRDITERKSGEEQLRKSEAQLRALAAHVQDIREEERSIMAREIHDELGQALTGLKMDVSFL